MNPTEMLRKLLSLSTITISEKTKNKLKNSTNLIQSSKNSSGNLPGHTIKYEKLYFEHRLCVPVGEIQKKILHGNHESLIRGHRGLERHNIY